MNWKMPFWAYKSNIINSLIADLVHVKAVGEGILLKKGKTQV